MGTLPGPPAPQPSREEKLVRRRARRVMLVVIVILATAGVTALVLLGVALDSVFDLGRSSPEPDAALLPRFHEHPAEFRELLALAWVDEGRRPGGAQVRGGDEKPRLSAGQRRRYRQLQRQLGIESVLIYKGEADFATASWGLVPSGWSQGYTWMQEPPAPLVADTLDNDSSSESVYRRLAGHWYLFYETW
jgi:hypothetical protein